MSVTISVGDKVPEFSTTNQRGEEVSPSSLAGAPALLVFFPFAFSGICTGELCEIRDNFSDFNNLGVRVVGISCDPGFSLAAWAKDEGYEFDVASDFWPHGEIAKKFGVFNEGIGAAERGSFLLDADGTVRWIVKTELGQSRSLDEYKSAIAEISTIA